ncbi:MAG TPA: hypothetical protein VJU78_06335, partial [Chitinophagaceae bacterium]|nr:hypothetical protein [Chitinophagaceae bacterium]
MKRMFSLLFLSFCVLAQAQLKYPETKKVDTITNYHGEQVTDPYRWLEDDWSAETKDWVTAQNKVTFDYL